MADFDSHWVERFHAIGRAQARYLWVLLLACLFYGALVKSDTGGGAALEVPVLGLKLDSGWVLASAGPVISFLLLVILGALRASSNVIAELKLGAGNTLRSASTRIRTQSTWPCTQPRNRLDSSPQLPTLLIHYSLAGRCSKQLGSLSQRVRAVHILVF